MISKRRLGKGVGSCSMAAVTGVVLLSLIGCAGEPAKTGPMVTPDQVRGNADRGFEKLKQDEKNRAVSPGSPY